MTAAAFLQTARQKISAEPYSRLAKYTQKAIENPKCMFDVHCHIFDRKSLRLPYIGLRMSQSGIMDSLGFESTDDFSQRTENDWYDIIKKRKKDSRQDKERFAAKIEQITNSESTSQGLQVLGKGNIKEVFEHYYDDFSIKNLADLNHRPLVTGVLMMDLETGWSMKAEKSYAQQVVEMKNLIAQKPILPFLALDPRRADLSGEDNLYQLFLKAFAEGENSFFGVKCYPALGYFPNDERLDPIFRICEEKNIPVTTHCGGESVSTFLKVIDIQCSDKPQRRYTIPGETRALRASFLNDPLHWEPVLEKYPKLKVNFAHFGSKDFWLPQITSRINDIARLVSDDRYNVFTDYSFNVVETEMWDKLKETLDNNSRVAEKVMFGTDYWVVLPFGDLFSQQEAFMEKFQPYMEGLLVNNPRKFLFEVC